MSVVIHCPPKGGEHLSGMPPSGREGHVFQDRDPQVKTSFLVPVGLGGCPTLEPYHNHILVVLYMY